MISEIDRLHDCLPRARAAFYADGFCLPSLYLSAIETMRTRDDVERNFQYYIDEVVREYAALKYPWQPSVRALLKQQERSSYLDMLESRFESTSATLDPNFKKFVNLNVDVWGGLLRQFREQKQKEMEQHYLQLIDLLGAPNCSLFNGIVKLASHFGFLPKHRIDAKKKIVDLDFQSARIDECEIRLVDLYAMRKQGSVTVQFFLRDFPEKPFGLDTFIPGGYLYSQWNKSPEMIFFSFYVQMKYMEKLCVEISEKRKG